MNVAEVIGCGTAAANGVYIPGDTIEDHPSFTVVGGGYTLRWAEPGSGLSRWCLVDDNVDSGGTGLNILYYDAVDEDLENPWNVEAWDTDTDNDGLPPEPTVALYQVPDVAINGIPLSISSLDATFAHLVAAPGSVPDQPTWGITAVLRRDDSVTNYVYAVVVNDPDTSEGDVFISPHGTAGSTLSEFIFRSGAPGVSSVDADAQPTAFHSPPGPYRITVGSISSRPYNLPDVVYLNGTALSYVISSSGMSTYVKHSDVFEGFSDWVGGVYLLDSNSNAVVILAGLDEVGLPADEWIAADPGVGVPVEGFVFDADTPGTILALDGDGNPTDLHFPPGPYTLSLLPPDEGGGGGEEGEGDAEPEWTEADGFSEANGFKAAEGFKTRYGFTVANGF